MRSYPEVGVLVLSHHVESAYAMRLLEEHPERSGYLLKDRISDIAVLTDALQRLTEGESVVDPTIVTRLLRRPRDPNPLADLTEREREVLTLIAEGRSNQAISDRLGAEPEDGRGAHPGDLHEARPRGGTRRPSAGARRPRVAARRLTVIRLRADDRRRSVDTRDARLLDCSHRS